MAGLDARGERAAIGRAVIQAEGWAGDKGTTESSGSPGKADGENGADDPDRD
jgi:hypothetical protein